MNAELLLAHFNRISDAPDAVSRLRRFVLDLAVRGKLVEQSRNDEPSVELLRRIQKQKARLVSSGEIRDKRPSEITVDDVHPFSIPGSWAWCRLSDIGAIIGGGTPPSSDLQNFTPGGTGIPWLTPADLGKKVDLYVSHGSRDLTPQGLRSSSATVMPKGAILFTSRAPIGYTAIAANDVSTNQGFKSVLPFIMECNLYIAVYFRAFARWIDGKASGTTFREVSGKIVAALPFPLPPLAEQHRIVTKVDELMALCDRLEAAQLERESRRGRLTAATHHHLNNGVDAEALCSHAQFFIGHLPRLTARPDQIKQLRQTILNLAIRGQLVHQDNNDEPAFFLLKRIASEIRQYSLERRITPLIPEPLERESLPHSVPKGWEWTRLSSLFNVITDGDHQPPPKEANGVAFLTIGNVTNGYLDFSNCRYVSRAYFDSLANYRKPAYGDILYTVVGATFGRPVLVDSKRPFCVQRHIAILKPTSIGSSNFLRLILASPFAYEQATRSITGTAQPTIPLRPLRNFLVPLPPLAEQRRIVAKVDELMALCDQLEARLTTAHTESSRLLESVLHNALNSTDERLESALSN